MAKKKKVVAKATPQKKSGSSAGRAKDLFPLPMVLGGVAVPVSGIVLSSILPVKIPPRYSSIVGAAAVVLGNMIAPKLISRDVARGAVVGGIAMVGGGMASDALGLSGPGRRPSLRELAESARANNGQGMQIPVERSLNMQVPVTRGLGATANMRNARPRRAF